MPYYETYMTTTSFALTALATTTVTTDETRETILDPVKQVRKIFPETWLWSNLTLP